ncbi:hypothetical protein Rhopal_002739-T1 [Rhodotorula paludigena]|uniref:Phosphoribosylaminoimidazolesuccinocarboxamide synthase n=1 Tax=Rhodotorula paludigena TaxID=86838 RepID=A0AAV5GB27_9BASI|nr:hypothetical protein Rhopal_002739-T1 [Rhodotorula paludigena]
MAASPLTYNLPTEYREAPDQQQRAALEQRRAAFLAKPLVTGASVPFTIEGGDCAYSPRRAAVLDAPVVALNPPRPLNRLLLDTLEGRPEQLFNLRLMRELWSGAGYRSQVWVGVVEDGSGATLGEVVVKLVVESLFPYPPGWKAEYVRWQPATVLAEREAYAYSCLQPLQGRDVPYCYGAGRFHMPNGEEVPGFLLEDLTPCANRIDKACSWAKEADTDAGDIEPVAVAIFEGMRRLFACGIVLFKFKIQDFFFLREFPADPHPVFIDFGTVESVDEFKANLRLGADEYYSADELEADWQSYDEAWVSGTLAEFFEEPYFDWLNEETLVTRRLGLRI